MIAAFNSFLHTHATSASVFLIATLAGIGYLETRLFPEAPMMAGTTWTLGLLILMSCVVGTRRIWGVGCSLHSDLDRARHRWFRPVLQEKED